MPVITLLGCGKMGAALLRGWLAVMPSAVFEVVEPQGLPEEFKSVPSIRWYAAAENIPPSDVAVLAVKPQAMDEACAALKPKLGPATLILSIAAGQSIASFERRFGNDLPIVRAMPNTPAAIGQGITVAVCNGRVSPALKHQADALLKAAGQVEWIDDESMMDAVTAVSGSGPAYVFLLIETLAAAGRKAGLPKDMAMTLARQTVIGASALAASDPGAGAADLRKNVTSPGGTTEAALKILMDENALENLMTEAVQAAASRSRVLGK